MKHLIRTASLLLCLAMALPGCAAWNHYRPLPAGGDAALWRPEGIVNIDFDAQTANPTDLIAGHGTGISDGRLAADAIDRMRRGRPTPLPASSISQVGTTGGASGGAGGP
jgi:hypothetical protein